MKKRFTLFEWILLIIILAIWIWSAGPYIRQAIIEYEFSSIEFDIVE